MTTKPYCKLCNKNDRVVKKDGSILSETMKGFKIFICRRCQARVRERNE